MNAKWELGSGRTVEFRLVEDSASETTINPFKHYVKRRSGRVGQRFAASFVEVSMQTPVYTGETMLAGWADTEKGKVVKFWLDEEASLHPFAGYGKRDAKTPGSMFMMVLALIHNDQQATEDVEERPTRRLSQSVHLMITSPLFCQFMEEKSKKTATIHKRGLHWHSMYEGEMVVKSYIKSLMKIESLADLDRDPSLARQFDEQIAAPFRKWNGGGTER